MTFIGSRYLKLKAEHFIWFLKEFRKTGYEMVRFVLKKDCITNFKITPNIACFVRCMSDINLYIYSKSLGASIAQWVKRWPTDLAVPSSSPASGEIFSTINEFSLHTAFHYQPLIILT